VFFARAMSSFEVRPCEDEEEEEEEEEEDER
jgi:hypothetical protein